MVIVANRNCKLTFIRLWAFLCPPLRFLTASSIADWSRRQRQLKGKNNPANVVLPTLIPLIDNVLTRFRQRNRLVYTTHGSQNQREELRVWVETEAISQDVLSEPMLELANYVLFSVFLQTAYPGKPLANPFSLSRHKIVHREFSTYGRESNVIRAFLILDFLSALE